MDKNAELDNNKPDLLAAVARGALGSIPYIGGLLGELVGTLIPNQRIDRLTKYVKELESRLAEVPVERINELLSNDDFIDLVEEGFLQATRGISQQRINYIAELVANGTKYEELQLQQSKHLLKILQELNDVEIIWLIPFSYTTVDSIEFKRRHGDLWSTGINFSLSDEEAAIKTAFQESYQEHLQRLNLLDIKQEKDHRTKMRKFHPITGEPVMSIPKITFLGRLLLKQIGLSKYH